MPNYKEGLQTIDENEFSDLEHIAEGNFGGVFKAVYTGNNPEFLRLMDSENRVALKKVHPNKAPKDEKGWNNLWKEGYLGRKMGQSTGCENGFIISRLITYNNSPDLKESTSDLNRLFKLLSKNEVEEQSPELQNLYNESPEIFMAMTLQATFEAQKVVHAAGVKHLDTACRNMMMSVPKTNDAGEVVGLNIEIMDWGESELLETNCAYVDKDVPVWLLPGQDGHQANVASGNYRNQYTDVHSLKVSMISLLTITSGVLQKETKFPEVILGMTPGQCMAERMFNHTDSECLNNYVNTVTHIDTNFANHEKLKPEANAALKNIMTLYREYLTTPVADHAATEQMLMRANDALVNQHLEKYAPHGAALPSNYDEYLDKFQTNVQRFESLSISPGIRQKLINLNFEKKPLTDVCHDFLQSLSLTTEDGAYQAQIYGQLDQLSDDETKNLIDLVSNKKHLVKQEMDALGDDPESVKVLQDVLGNLEIEYNQILQTSEDKKINDFIQDHGLTLNAHLPLSPLKYVNMLADMHELQRGNMSDAVADKLKQLYEYHKDYDAHKSSKQYLQKEGVLDDVGKFKPVVPKSDRSQKSADELETLSQTAQQRVQGISDNRVHTIPNISAFRLLNNIHTQCQKEYNSLHKASILKRFQEKGVLDSKNKIINKPVTVPKDETKLVDAWLKNREDLEELANALEQACQDLPDSKELPKIKSNVDKRLHQLDTHFLKKMDNYIQNSSIEDGRQMVEKLGHNAFKVTNPKTRESMLKVSGNFIKKALKTCAQNAKKTSRQKTIQDLKHSASDISSILQNYRDGSAFESAQITALVQTQEKMLHKILAWAKTDPLILSPDLLAVIDRDVLNYDIDNDHDHHIRKSFQNHGDLLSELNNSVNNNIQERIQLYLSDLNDSEDFRLGETGYDKVMEELQTLHKLNTLVSPRREVPPALEAITQKTYAARINHLKQQFDTGLLDDASMTKLMDSLNTVENDFRDFNVKLSEGSIQNTTALRDSIQSIVLNNKIDTILNQEISQLDEFDAAIMIGDLVTNRNLLTNPSPERLQAIGDKHQALSDHVYFAKQGAIVRDLKGIVSTEAADYSAEKIIEVKTKLDALLGAFQLKDEPLRQQIIDYIEDLEVRYLEMVIDRDISTHSAPQQLAELANKFSVGILQNGPQSRKSTVFRDARSRVYSIHAQKLAPVKEQLLVRPTFEHDTDDRQAFINTCQTQNIGADVTSLIQGIVQRDDNIKRVQQAIDELSDKIENESILDHELDMCISLNELKNYFAENKPENDIPKAITMLTSVEDSINLTDKEACLQRIDDLARLSQYESLSDEQRHQVKTLSHDFISKLESNNVAWQDGDQGYATVPNDNATSRCQSILHLMDEHPDLFNSEGKDKVHPLVDYLHEFSERVFDTEMIGSYSKDQIDILYAVSKITVAKDPSDVTMTSKLADLVHTWLNEAVKNTEQSFHKSMLNPDMPIAERLENVSQSLSKLLDMVHPMHNDSVNKTIKDMSIQQVARCSEYLEYLHTERGLPNDPESLEIYLNQLDTLSHQSLPQEAKSILESAKTTAIQKVSELALESHVDTAPPLQTRIHELAETRQIDLGKFEELAEEISQQSDIETPEDLQALKQQLYNGLRETVGVDAANAPEVTAAAKNSGYTATQLAQCRAPDQKIKQAVIADRAQSSGASASAQPEEQPTIKLNL